MLYLKRNLITKISLTMLGSLGLLGLALGLLRFEAQAGRPSLNQPAATGQTVTFSLTTSQSSSARAGQTVIFSHTLTNNGSGSASTVFTLTAQADWGSPVRQPLTTALAPVRPNRSPSA